MKYSQSFVCVCKITEKPESFWLLFSSSWGSGSGTSCSGAVGGGFPSHDHRVLEVQLHGKHTRVQTKGLLRP